MVDLTTTTRYFNHINYKCELWWHCQLYVCNALCWLSLEAVHVLHTVPVWRQTHAGNNTWLHVHTPLLPRGPCSSTCFCTPSPHSTFYSVWFTVLYLWANRPKLTAPEKAHRCTLKVHHNVTHIAQPLSAAQSSSPQTLMVSMVHCCTWSPTLNMEMLWKQNLNIYIRWLWKRGCVLLFIQPPCCMYFLCSGWGGEAEKGRKGRLVCMEYERQPSEKVKTVHQQIRQQCTIHHVPGLSRGSRAQIETSKIINTGEPCHQGLSIP